MRSRERGLAGHKTGQGGRNRIRVVVQAQCKATATTAAAPDSVLGLAGVVGALSFVWSRRRRLPAMTSCKPQPWDMWTFHERNSTGKESAQRLEGPVGSFDDARSSKLSSSSHPANDPGARVGLSLVLRRPAPVPTGCPGLGKGVDAERLPLVRQRPCTMPWQARREDMQSWPSL